MRADFEQKKQEFLKLKAKRDTIRESLQRDELALTLSKSKLNAAERGLHIIREVAQSTQRNLEYHISNLVTTALSSVSSDFPEFEAEIEIQRNKTSLQLYFVESGTRSKPIETSGGGPLDIASFALRTSFWSLNKNRPTFILDEPFKFVSPGLQSKVSEMLKMLSDKLGLQIIMVSHAEEINYSADKTFHVEKVGKESKVRVE
jgi:DNA repair exonuclease SbcCD ATPase subunit